MTLNFCFFCLCLLSAGIYRRASQYPVDVVLGLELMASCTLSKHYTIDRASAPGQGQFLKGVVLEAWTKSTLLKQKLGASDNKAGRNPTSNEQGPGAGGVSAAWRPASLGVSDEAPGTR